MVRKKYIFILFLIGSSTILSQYTTPSEPQKELLYAINNVDVAKVHAILQKNPTLDINYETTDTEDACPLIQGVELLKEFYMSELIVPQTLPLKLDFLFSKPTNFNIRNALSVLELLLQYKANPTTKRKNRNSPFMYFIEQKEFVIPMAGDTMEASHAFAIIDLIRLSLQHAIDFTVLDDARLDTHHDTKTYQALLCQSYPYAIELFENHQKIISNRFSEPLQQRVGFDLALRYDFSNIVYEMLCSKHIMDASKSDITKTAQNSKAREIVLNYFHLIADQGRVCKGGICTNKGLPLELGIEIFKHLY